MAPPGATRVVKDERPPSQWPARPRRLRPAGAPLHRQALEREAKKKARVSELEQRIAAAEQQVKAIETRMAEPGFYEDREQAEHVVKERETLMWRVGDLMGQWEAVRAELGALIAR